MPVKTKSPELSTAHAHIVHTRCERADDGDSSSKSEDAFTLACMKTETIQRVKPFEVNKKTVNFYIDTGCSVSLMNENKFNEIWEANKAHK